MSTPDDAQKRLGERIRRAILAKYASLREFSTAENVPYRTLQSYVAGRKPPHWAFLDLISDRTGASLDELFGRQQDAQTDVKTPDRASGVSARELPIYVREMLNIPPWYYEKLSERRLELLVESFRLTTGRDPEDLARSRNDDTKRPERSPPGNGSGRRRNS